MVAALAGLLAAWRAEQLVATPAEWGAEMPVVRRAEWRAGRLEE